MEQLEISIYIKTYDLIYFDIFYVAVNKVVQLNCFVNCSCVKRVFMCIVITYKKNRTENVFKLKTTIGAKNFFNLIFIPYDHFRNTGLQ